MHYQLKDPVRFLVSHSCLKDIFFDKTPTDDAFAALEDGILENLFLSENIDQLTDILTYHVIAGNCF